MTDVTIRDFIEGEIRILGIWNVKATMYFEGMFDNMYDFHEILRSGDLNDLLGVPSEIDDDDLLAEYIECYLDPDVMVIEISTPVKEGGNSYSWGYTQTYHAKGRTLQELYNNAYEKVYPKEHSE